MSKLKTIWFDFDNTPHVQYLLPVALELSRQGYKMVYTARDYSQTVPLLKSKKVPFKTVGRAFGSSKISKVSGTIYRGIRLYLHLRNEKPHAVFSSSRAATLAAYLLKIPSFIFCDYEHVELELYRRLGAFIVAPDVIPKNVFEQKKFNTNKIILFPGLKEDLSLYSVEFDAYQPFVKSDLVTVLVRPPAQEGHYFLEKSLAITNETLHFLSSREDVLLVLSPRYHYQISLLAPYKWANDPIILEKPVPFISLFKSVDLAISSGGTMLREAAVLGIPAYSILGNKQGYVDMSLEKTGRLTFISSIEEIAEKIKLVKQDRKLTYRPNTKAMQFIISNSLQKLQ